MLFASLEVNSPQAMVVLLWPHVSFNSVEENQVITSRVVAASNFSTAIRLIGQEYAVCPEDRT
jgi:hypothetical protein